MIEVDANNQEATPKRYRKHGFACSLALHVSLLIAVVAIALPDSWNPKAASSGPLPTTTATPAAAADQSSTDITVQDGQVDESSLRRELERRIDDASRLTQKEQLDELDAAARKLDRISSPESINQAADRAIDLFSLKDRVSEPVDRPSETTSTNDIPEEFDPGTAQFHDVRRLEDPDDASKGPRYIAVLIDADGRLQEVEMSVEDGEQVWETMQRIKANPLVNAIYRRLVLPMLDKLLDELPPPVDGE